MANPEDRNDLNRTPGTQPGRDGGMDMAYMDPRYMQMVYAGPPLPYPGAQLQQETAKKKPRIGYCRNCGAWYCNWKFCEECGSLLDPTAQKLEKGYCHHCAAPFSGGTYCPACGAPLNPTGVCPGCGSYTGGGKFCQECGRPLKPAGGENAP